MRVCAREGERDGGVKRCVKIPKVKVIKKQECTDESEWRSGGRSCECDISEAPRRCSAQLGPEIALAAHAVKRKSVMRVKT